ncbi:MAG: Dethiobiotin synthetase [Nevskia sp.]|nr:Dethiobiotin synthetase [Nevskia sp.]
MSAATGTLFITGTDTGVGKTRIACGVLDNFRARGWRAAGFKPVAAGAVATSAGLRNDDALALLAASTPGLSYDAVNPYCFAAPIAPHLAARAAGQRIELAQLDAAYKHLSERHDRVVIEGAGGWLVPLDAESSFADWVAAHRWPVLLVVGIRLGCINHALLSAEAIRSRTLLHGWVANLLPPVVDATDQIVESLRTRLPAPLLGTVTADADAARTAAQLAAVDTI